MADSRNTSIITSTSDKQPTSAQDFPLAQLPESLLTHITDYYDTQTALATTAALARTNRRFCGLFEGERSKALAYKLLTYVDNADHAKADAIVSKHQHLMFTRLQDPYNTSRMITPLKLAFKHYDTHMWGLFLNVIEKDDHVKEFFKQKEEQTEHDNIDELSAAYQTVAVYTEAYNKEKKEKANYGSDKVNYTVIEALNAAWVGLGVAQSRLAKHLLKTFCSEPFWDSAEFNKDRSPWPDSSIVCDYNAKVNIDLFKEENFFPFASGSMMLFRGRFKQFPFTMRIEEAFLDAKNDDNFEVDIAAFTRLYKKRKSEFDELKVESVLAPATPLCQSRINNLQRQQPLRQHQERLRQRHQLCIQMIQTQRFQIQLRQLQVQAQITERQLQQSGGRNRRDQATRSRAALETNRLALIERQRADIERQLAATQQTIEHLHEVVYPAQRRMNK